MRVISRRSIKSCERGVHVGSRSLPNQCSFEDLSCQIDVPGLRDSSGQQNSCLLIEQPGFGNAAFQMRHLNIVLWALWTTYDPGLSQLAGYRQDDYNRGLSTVSQGNSADAAKWFSLAVKAAPLYEQGLPRLVRLFSQRGELFP
jgi:hypothetical protein